ncbi:hypothetical protein N7513_007920 [Penicillium frequentans]|nr:hypothetical protein N7513_007920 [Penicillium glabrum]
MRALTLIAFVPFALGQLDMLNLDCTNYPGPCNNDCYAAYVANKPITLNYNGPDGQSNSRRRAAGCVSPSPCGNGKLPTQSSDENTCDEYPYASTVEGGSGSILRCTSDDENSAEGSDLSAFFNSVCGYEPCTFEVTFGNPGGGSTPYCLDGGGANDGYQYQYQGNGNYQLYNRDSNATNEGRWGLHQPDPAHYFPPHLRREFLLEDGSRTVLSTGDQTTSYQNATFHTVRNGTVIKHRAVKELLGSEKSPELQHPALRASKRAVQFAS